MAPVPQSNPPSKVDTMQQQQNSTASSERTNVLVATGGLAVVLLVATLSTLVTAAVVATMVGIAITYRLTASPVQVVRAEVPVEQRRTR
jgi:hypothetical protein